MKKLPKPAYLVMFFSKCSCIPSLDPFSSLPLPPLEKHEYLQAFFSINPCGSNYDTWHHLSPVLTAWSFRVAGQQQLRFFPADRISSSRRLSGRKNEHSPQGPMRQYSMVPTVKLFEKLLLTPCPALRKTNDLLHQHEGDLSYKCILSTYCLAFCAFHFNHKSCHQESNTHVSAVWFM